MFDGVRPSRSPAVRQFEVGDELVLIAASGGDADTDHGAENRAMALNASGRKIWDLCDGKRPIGEIANVLSREFDVPANVMLDHVSTAVSALAGQSFLSRESLSDSTRPATVFTIGIEDKPYFWWQIAILLQSFEGKLPFGWRPFIVVCNNNERVSPQLQDLLDAYRVQFTTATNHANTYKIDVGLNGGHCHGGMNKIEALAAVADYVGDEEVIFLLDSDMFLFEALDLDVMPIGCAVAKSYHIEQDLFLSSAGADVKGGIRLQKVLDAIGCERAFKPGGVNIFVTGATAKKPKFIADCFRFAHAILLLGRAAGINETWIAEMPCYALAMTVNDTDYAVLDTPHLLISSCNEAAIPTGTFYHYYSAKNDEGKGAFHGSSWCKQDQGNSFFLEEDMTPYIDQAATDHERYFFKLALAAKERLNV